MQKKQVYYILLFLIIFLSVFLRFHKITYRDFWYDEAFTGVIIKWDWHTMMNGLIRDVHPPLYYLLLKPWASIFNYSVWGLRGFSAVFGIATVILAFLLVKRIFKSWPLALITGFVIAIAPFNIQYAQEARMYSLFGFLMLCAIYFFYSSFSTHKWRNSILWALFFGLAINTHYLSFFMAPLFYLAFIFLRNAPQILDNNWKTKLRRITLRFLPDKYFFVSIGIIILTLLPWLKVLIKHLTKHSLGWIPPAHFSDLPRTIQIFFFGSPPGMSGVPEPSAFKYLFFPDSLGLLIYSLILVLIFIFWLRNKTRIDNSKKLILLLSIFSFGLPVVLIIASHFKIYLYVSRYFAPSAIVMQILLVALLWKVLNRKVVLAFVGIYVLLIFNLNIPPVNHNFQLLPKFLKEKNLENAKIYALDPGEFTILRYYLDPEQVYLFNKNNPNEDFSGWVSVGNEKRITKVEDLLQDKTGVIVGKIEVLEKETERVGQVGSLEVYQIKR